MTYFNVTNYSIYYDLILPENCKDLRLPSCLGSLTITTKKPMTITFGENAGSHVEKALAAVPIDGKIVACYIVRKSFQEDTDLSMFKRVYQSRENNKLNLEKLYIQIGNGKIDKIDSLKGIEYLDGLKVLQLSKGVFENLSNITDLASHALTLENLSIQGASISDMSALNACVNLTDLNLSNNAISDASAVSSMVRLIALNLEDNCLLPKIDFENGEKWFTLKEICDRMRNNSTSLNKIVTLKLRYNSSIIDWSEYTKDTSKFATNSTYGAT